MAFRFDFFPPVEAPATATAPPPADAAPPSMVTVEAAASHPAPPPAAAGAMAAAPPTGAIPAHLAAVATEPTTSPPPSRIIPIDLAAVCLPPSATAVEFPPPVGVTLLTAPPPAPSIVLGTAGRSGSGDASKGGDDEAAVEAVAAAPAVVEDLRPGVYEGGAKLWEGTTDLLAALTTEGRGVPRGGRVLELGAGHGLGGVTAIRGGAGAVVLQDFNEEVLAACTAVAVALNYPGGVPGREDAAAPAMVDPGAGGGAGEAPATASAASAAVGVVGCPPYTCGGVSSSSSGPDAAPTPTPPAAITFVAGDWRSFPSLGFPPFDLVLSAETVYAPRDLPALAAAVAASLAPGGVALIAGKRYYFGVGGGTSAFAALLRGGGYPGLSVEVVWVGRDGRSNVREVLRVTKEG